MDNREMACLFSGYGYQPRIVEDLDDIDADMNASLEWALQEIKAIQTAARSGSPITKPRWPMLILRTPKGWGCPKEMHGEIIEGSFRSHQVPLPKAKSDPTELESLQNWLNSYQPHELFTDHDALQKSIERILPLQMDKRLGIALTKWNKSVPLDLPDWKDHSVQRGTQASCTRTASYFLDDAFCRNKESLRIFSPDELVSNKLDTVFQHSNRNFQWDEYSMNKGGQVIEMLSEHTLQGIRTSIPSFLNCYADSGQAFYKATR
jgi:xylulose-5-phosphate/fructose-6-phosphate phosphoketolase